ncbi:MAG: C25 family cysteine peptidase, partial [bacterium]
MRGTAIIFSLLWVVYTAGFTQDGGALEKGTELSIQEISSQEWILKINTTLSEQTNFQKKNQADYSNRFVVNWIAIPTPQNLSLKSLDLQIKDQPKVMHIQNSETLISSAIRDSKEWLVIGRVQTLRGVPLVPIIVDLKRLSNLLNDEYQQIVLTAHLQLSSQNQWKRTAPLPQNSSPIWEEILTTLSPTPQVQHHFPRRDPVYRSLGTLLIIYPQQLEDQEALAALRQFSLWKQRMGYRVIMQNIPTRQTSPSEIRQIILNAYQDEGIDFVILVGTDLHYQNFPRDPQLFFPSFPIAYEVIDNPDPMEDDTLFYNSDLRFGCLDEDEDDILPEVIVARLMAPNPQSLRGIIGRIMEYERSPYLQADGGEWLTRALTLSDFSDPGADVNAGDREFVFWLAEACRRGGYSNVSTIIGNRDDFTAAQVQQIIEQEGVALILGDGYLWGTINPNDLGAYAFSGRKYPFLVGLANHYGAPMLYPYFASVTPDQMTGPIGALGLFIYAHIAQRTKPFLTGVARGIAYRNVWTVGELYLNALIENTVHLALAEAYGFDEPEGVIEASKLFRLLGDPTIQIRSQPPNSILADLPESLPVGAQSFSIALTNEEGDPWRGVNVTVGQQGRPFYSTVSDELGWARFTIPGGL